jgi:hypothetical protein
MIPIVDDTTSKNLGVTEKNNSTTNTKHINTANNATTIIKLLFFIII